MPPVRFARPTPLSPAWRLFIFSTLVVAIVVVGFLLGRQTFRMVWGTAPAIQQDGQAKTASVPPPMTGIINIELASPTPPTSVVAVVQPPKISNPTPTPAKTKIEPPPPIPPAEVKPVEVVQSKPVVPAASPDRTNPVIGSKVMIQNSDGLIVRRGPGSPFARIARLDRGSRVQIKGVRKVAGADWVEISIKKGKAGWVPVEQLFP